MINNLLIILLLFSGFYIILLKLIKEKGLQLFKEVKNEGDINKPRIYLWTASFIFIIVLSFALYNFKIKDSILSLIAYGLLWTLNLLILFFIYKITDDSVLVKLFVKQIQLREETVNKFQSNIENTDHEKLTSLNNSIISDNKYLKTDNEWTVNQTTIGKARWVVNKLFEYKFAITDEVNIAYLNKLINKDIEKNRNSFSQIVDEIKNAGISITPTKSMTQLSLIFSELINKNIISKLEVEYLFESGIVISRNSTKSAKERIEEFRKHHSNFYGNPKKKMDNEKKQLSNEQKRNKVERSKEIIEMINQMILM